MEIATPTVAGVESGKPAGQRDRIERDARVIVLAHEGEGLPADRPVAEGGALGAAGDDADVLHPRESTVLEPAGNRLPLAPSR